MSAAADVLDIALVVARALEEVGIAYFLGGSLASSFQGEPRATNDIDFVVALDARQVQPLAHALGDDFEVDVDALLETLRAGGSWNIFYLPWVTKVDLFVRGSEPFDLSEFHRRQRVQVRADGASMYIKSPEDSILRKLLWFRASSGESSRQWRDIVEVLRVSGPHLDSTYLDDWAGRLDLAGPLAKARSEAG